MNLSHISSIIHAAIEQRIFPGAVVLVAKGGQIVHRAAYGGTTYEGEQRVDLTTIYDVASLTKMFTATAALRLVDAGRLELDASVQVYLPQFAAPDVTIRHLFTHTSGIDIRLSTLRELGRGGLLAQVLATMPQRPPGSTVAYSNVNSLLLGEIVSALRGTPLEIALADLVIRPLGLRDTGFCPGPALLPRIAPTEYDTTWRGALVHGSVHDESTAALGGVAGHAGLFSTAEDIGVFCEHWRAMLADCSLGEALLSWELVRQATTNQTAGLAQACGLGWMIDRLNFMGVVPPGSFGHTGFTGPAMVVVPQHDTIVVVMNNRIYPQRGPAVHHAVIAAVVAAASG
ncbi:MAG: beta-lactamase family protein [Roseiflexaceae bacterium]|nr:beta-lactamase family protein [Roseiflexaceae bacterium]